MAEPLLQIAGLTYTYSDGTQALRGVDLAVRGGEKVGLVGQNGSGKSTLLMCVSGSLLGQGRHPRRGRRIDRLATARDPRARRPGLPEPRRSAFHAHAGRRPGVRAGQPGAGRA